MSKKSSLRAEVSVRIGPGRWQLVSVPFQRGPLWRQAAEDLARQAVVGTEASFMSIEPSRDEAAVTVVCDTLCCPEQGKAINALLVPKRNLTLFLEAFGQGSEDAADYCPACLLLGTTEVYEYRPLPWVSRVAA